MIDSLIFDMVEPCGKLLEIGCYNGYSLSELKGIEEKHGIDMDADAIKEARKRYPGIKFEIGYAESMPYENGYFDTVLLISTFEHIEDEAVLLREINRVLKNGGMLILSTPNKTVLDFLDPLNFKFYFPGAYRMFNKLAHAKGHYEAQHLEKTGKAGLPFHKHYSIDELNAFFKASGFRITRWATVGFVMYHLEGVVNAALLKLFNKKSRLLMLASNGESLIDLGHLGAYHIVKGRKVRKC